MNENKYFTGFLAYFIVLIWVWLAVLRPYFGYDVSDTPLAPLVSIVVFIPVATIGALYNGIRFIKLDSSNFKKVLVAKMGVGLSIISSIVLVYLLIKLF